MTVAELVRNQGKGTRTSLMWLVVISVLFSAAYLGHRPSTLVFGGIVGAIAVGILLMQPQLSPVLILLTALALPLKIGTGTDVSLNLAVLLTPALLAMVLSRAIAHQRSYLALFRQPLIRWSLIFALLAIMSFVLGYVFWPPLMAHSPLTVQLGQLLIYLVAMSAILLAASAIQDIVWLKWLIMAFLIVGGLQLIGEIAPIVGRLIPTAPGAHGSMFWVWLTAITGSQLLFRHEIGRAFRLVLIGVLATIFVFSLYNRDWTSGWLPVTATLGFLLFLRFKPAPRLILILAFLLILVTIGIEPVYEFAGGDHAATTTGWPRLVLYRAALEPVWERPLLGAGMTAYRYFHYNKILVYQNIIWTAPRISSHNDFVDVLAQTGFLGLGAFLMVLVTTARTAWQMRIRYREAEGSFTWAYIHGILAGLIGTTTAGMLGNWLVPFVYNGGFAGLQAAIPGWLFIGGLVALNVIGVNSLSVSQNGRRN